jgi:putative acetyltransferase
MHSNSPPGHVIALAIEALKRPDLTFSSVWSDAVLCGCGALKELGPASGEIKSMRTRSAFLRRGFGQFLLDEIIRTAQSRIYKNLYLEAGTGPAFEAAHRLYVKNDLTWCGSFDGYAATDVIVFMTKNLDYQ